jgi:hydroxymethylpyrimidine pyrophosphatase-like HAD family hydrolase
MRIELARPIRIFACDFDGVLAAVDHAAFDLPRLARIAALNRRSASDPTVPALTLVTGRPHAFVDAISQMLDLRLPASFENGAGLSTRHPYRAWLSPAVASARSHLDAAERLLAARRDVFLQPGKMASFSVFPVEPSWPIDDLALDLAAMLSRHAIPLHVDPSTGCVNLLLPGIDKATGFADLLAEIQIDADAVAGIGDAVGDVGWMRACGVAIAPANAVPEVAAIAQVRSEQSDVVAALAAYEALVAANRRLLEG